MNAPAGALRYARAPVASHRASARPGPSRRRQAVAINAAKINAPKRVAPKSLLVRAPAHRDRASRALSRSLAAIGLSAASLGLAAKGLARAAIVPIAVDVRTTCRLGAAALAGAVMSLAIMNNQRSDSDLLRYSAAGNETIIYRQMPARRVAVEEDAGEPADIDSDESIPAGYPRAVQTVKFVNPDAAKTSGFAALRARVMEKAGAFIAFPGKRSTEQSASAGAEWSSNRWKKSEPSMEQVDRYLWEVYQRAPTKKDHSGDFTWKDPAAAKHMGMSIPEYVIGGMDPDFREQLYHAGQAMDAAGIQWSMLSAFRDDYRQNLAKGFKARVGNSLHGGSRATGGYGHGRAVDLTVADGDAEVVWKWVDAHGAKFGLYRPIPGPDPAHVQSRGDWHKLAVALREGRVRTADAASAAVRQAPTAKGKVAKAW